MTGTVRPIRIFTVLLLVQLASIAHAQITLDGSMGTAGALTGPNYSIPSTVGQTRGGNLFHSFGLFNVLTNQSATFTGPNSISNIFGRVTGGQASNIDGTIRSTIPNASLYLMNPAGMLFGPNASLDVQGSFHAATSDYLEFADGAKFHADLSRQSTLTTAPPSAFGFLGDNPPQLAAGSSAAVTIEGLDARGASVIVVGRDGIPEGSVNGVGGVAVRGELTSAGGQVTLASVAAPGNVPLTDSGTVSLFDESGHPLLAKLGTIVMSDQAIINVSGNRGGKVIIRGGVLMVENASVSADTVGDEDVAGIGIKVEMSEKIILKGASKDDEEIKIGFFSSSEGAGKGGNIEVTAPQILLSGESQIVSETKKNGRGGDVIVRANTVTLTDDAEIASDVEDPASADASGGKVTITADRIILVSGAESSPEISSDTEGAGAGGRISLIASKEIGIRIQGEEGGVFTNSKRGSGASGAISLETPILQMDGGVITARTETVGKGGNVVIRAGRIQLTNHAEISAKSTSDAPGAGLAGNITLSGVDTLHLADNSSVTTEAAIAGGGNITVLANSEVRLSGSKITTAVGRGEGGGGNIFIDPQFVILNNSQITANAFGGPGGNITIIADNFLSSTDSAVTASSALSTPGTVDIQAPITDLSSSLAPLPESIVQATSLLRQSCAARYSEGKLSSLASPGRGGMPFEPGGLLASVVAPFGDLAMGQVRSETFIIASAQPRFSVAAPCGTLY